MIIVVLEGPDLAGKSTLAAALAAEINGHAPLRPITHIRSNGPPPDDHNALVGYTRQIDEAVLLRAQGISTVFDRLHIGELIYGPLYRGKSQLDEHQLFSFEALLDKHNVLKIHLNSDEKTLAHRLEVRKDDMVKDSASLNFIASRYRTIISDLKGWIEFDSADPSAKENILDRVRQLMGKV